MPNSFKILFSFFTSSRQDAILTAVSFGVNRTARNGGGVVGLLRPPKLWYIPKGSSSKVDHSLSSASGGVQQVSGFRYFRRFLCNDFIPKLH